MKRKRRTLKELHRDSNLGSVIRDRLEELGLSQVDLADKVGTSRPVISHMLCGARYMKEEERKKISEVLGIDLEGLPQPKDPPRRAQYTEIGEAIRERLHVLGSTPAKLAEKAGTSQSDIRRIMYGSYLSLRKRRKIEEILEITLPEPQEPEEPLWEGGNDSVRVPLKQRVASLETQMTRVIHQLSMIMDELGIKEDQDD